MPQPDLTLGIYPSYFLRYKGGERRHLTPSEGKTTLLFFAHAVVTDDMIYDRLWPIDGTEPPICMNEIINLHIYRINKRLEGTPYIVALWTWHAHGLAYRDSRSDVPGKKRIRVPCAFL